MAAETHSLRCRNCYRNSRKDTQRGESVWLSHNCHYVQGFLFHQYRVNATYVASCSEIQKWN